jgi:hypothetical protein
MKAVSTDLLSIYRENICIALATPAIDAAIASESVPTLRTCITSCLPPRHRCPPPLTILIVMDAVHA